MVTHRPPAHQEDERSPRITYSTFRFPMEIVRKASYGIIVCHHRKNQPRPHTSAGKETTPKTSTRHRGVVPLAKPSHDIFTTTPCSQARSHEAAHDLRVKLQLSEAAARLERWRGAVAQAGRKIEFQSYRSPCRTRTRTRTRCMHHPPPTGRVTNYSGNVFPPVGAWWTVTVFGPPYIPRPRVRTPSASSGDPPLNAQRQGRNKLTA